MYLHFDGTKCCKKWNFVEQWEFFHQFLLFVKHFNEDDDGGMSEIINDDNLVKLKWLWQWLLKGSLDCFFTVEW